MPGSDREVYKAEEEGVKFIWLSNPVKFVGTDKKNALQTKEIPEEFINKKFSDLKNYFYETDRVLCIGICNEKENLGFSDFLSSDNSRLDAFIEKKLEKTGHSLEKENSTHVKLNPENDYIIKKNENAIVIS